MRIALVTESFDDVSGLGRIASALAGEFVARHHTVYALSQFSDKAPAGVNHVRASGVQWSPALSKLVFRQMSPRKLQDAHADIIHSFGVGRSADVVSAQSCHRAGVDVHRSLRGVMITGRNFGLFDRVVLADERRLMTSPATRRIIAVSRLVKRQLLETYTLSESKISVIPNGVHLEKFQMAQKGEHRRELRRGWNLSDSDFAFLFVGNEFGRKGLKIAIEALGRLHRPELRLIVVGRDNAEPYRRLASTLQVDDAIRFYGPASAPEKIYSGADALLFPTLYEPFGMVVIEAMAAGLPVITSKECGAVEGMNSGEHGLYLDSPDSVDEVAAAMNTIADNAHLRSALSQNGMLKAREFEWGGIAERVLKEYQSVLESGEHA